MVVSGSATERRDEVLRHLDSLPSSEPALIVGASLSAARRLLFDAVRRRQAAFGWQATTLDLVARRLAVPRLAERDLAPISGATLSAIVARTLATAGPLGRYDRVREAPGLPAALAKTIAELRMAAVPPESVAAIDPDLGTVYAGYCSELERVGLVGLVDRAAIYETARAATTCPSYPWPGAPVVLLDPALESEREGELIAALARAAPSAMATAVRGDARSIRLLEAALSVEATAIDTRPSRNLERAQRSLFAPVSKSHAPDESIQLFSAPNESRECVELARQILALASDGTRFDQVGVFLRAPGIHRTHLVEAFARAQIPAFFSRGTTRPDPAGRALLTLLDCADESLSARAFAEYLSLSVLPANPSPEAFGAPDDFPIPEAIPADSPAADDEPAPIRAPRRWERFIVDAAVIGGLDRWRRRLRGRANELRLAAEASDPDGPRARRLAADLEILEALETYAMPILELLDALPAEATWGVWLERLRRLTRLAIRGPEPVLAVLAELEPMGPVGPVSLLEVRAVLAERLGDLVERPRNNPAGAVYVGTVDDARGLAFDAVFVPGLAETVFPPKLLEDPILLDETREVLDPSLATTDDRVRAERTLLQVAVGAAGRRLVISYARLDGEQARPRVPSFYGLEVLRAGEGALSGFKAYARRAHVAGQTRMGWPAPSDSTDAIDETEYDLAVLTDLFRDKPPGAARYLLETNAHLARALRFRARRWSLARWTHADGLVELAPEVLAHLQAHQLSERVYSATALQRYGACPYRFYLHSTVHLSPRDVPAPIEDLGPLERGSLIHEIQFRFLRACREQGYLPLRVSDIVDARELLDTVATAIAREYREKLAPAIERVWTESVHRVRRDLWGWLERVAESDWTPAHFELAFGLPSTEDRDPHSRAEPVELDSGIALRGAIDLVERSGSLWRATDNKTGRKPFKPRFLVIGGGQVLQPALYALALEKLLGDAEVAGGRLFYCTDRGEYASETVALDDRTRESVDLLARSIGGAIEAGFLPAAPARGACDFCDYTAICGPYEEQRTRRKDPARLESLLEIRRSP